MQSPEERQVSVQFSGPTPTPTNTPLPTDTPTPGPSPTPIPPTATFTPTPVPPTPTNTPTILAGANTALQFDGVNDFVSAGPSVGGGPVTVEMWLRPTTANETGIVVLGGNDDSGWSLEMENGRIFFWVRTNQGWQSNSHPTALQAGTWVHVAATYGSSSIRTFVNGQPSTASTAGATLTQGSLLQMGAFAGYPAFAGALDDVRISNVVRYTAAFVALRRGRWPIGDGQRRDAEHYHARCIQPGGRCRPNLGDWLSLPEPRPDGNADQYATAADADQHAGADQYTDAWSVTDAVAANCDLYADAGAADADQHAGSACQLGVEL
jgi:hypothetical protein